MEVTTTGPAEARTIPSSHLSQIIQPRVSRLQDPQTATRAHLLGATAAEAVAALVITGRRTMIETTPMAISVADVIRRQPLMNALCCSTAMIQPSTPMVSQTGLIAS
jgi:hypothetical protein